MINVKTLDMERSPSLRGAGGQVPLTSKNNLGAFVHHPECFIYSSGISFKKHNCIYFFHILAHYVNVQVVKCGPYKNLKRP